MKKMMIFIQLVCISVFLFSNQWPTKKTILTATFGEQRGDHFHNGIDIGGGEQVVFPFEEGELLFYFSEGETPDALPSGMGNFVFLEHESNLRSFYGHLKENSLHPGKLHFNEEEQLGVIGATGYSIGKHLHYGIIDRELNQIVNPLLLLPSLPDTIKPRIEALKLVSGNKTVILNNEDTLPEGEWSLYANIYDISEWVDYFLQIAPYNIKVTYNGQNLFEVSFDAIDNKDGEILLIPATEKLRVSTLYNDTWEYYIGTLEAIKGNAQLEVQVKDFKGNETKQTYRFRIIEGNTKEEED